MERHKFEQIASRMQKKYGKIKKGKEESHEMLLFPMESNLLKTHRSHPSANSRRLVEAILLTLHYIDMKIEGKDEDLTQYENEENLMLKNALLQAFDPFANNEIYEIMTQTDDTGQSAINDLEKYYGEPARCILRIKESVELMFKEYGTDGYFDFIEEYMGKQIPDDDKMNYAVCVGKE